MWQKLFELPRPLHSLEVNKNDYTLDKNMAVNHLKVHNCPIVSVQEGLEVVLELYII